MTIQQQLWIVTLLLFSSTLARSQSFCLSNSIINKTGTESYRIQENIQPCKIYWINVYLHRIQGFLVDGVGNGWQDYHPNIDSKIMENLNSSFNHYGIYFQLAGARDWFTRTYTDPERHNLSLLGIFDDPNSLQHEDAIDIYLLPSNSKVSGGFVPGNNKKVMLIGGTRTVEHCSGESTSYQVATTKVVSHEMGHCLGLPHTFDESIGTDVDYVTENACVDPGTCQFVSNCQGCNVSSNPTLNMNNFMSYTIPNCMSEFTDEQLNRLRENLNNSMASVVNRTQGVPTDISEDLIGPSEVSTGSVVWFNVADQTDGVETFTWSIPTGFMPTGEETRTSIQTWIGSAAESGNIGVRKTNLCGTSDEKYKYVTVIKEDCLDCPGIKVFPNPAFENLYISNFKVQSDQEHLDSPQEYVIVDLSGKTVHKSESIRKNLILRLDRIKTGIYILIITDGNSSTYRQKLTIIK
jgi:hypothetical protein